MTMIIETIEAYRDFILVHTDGACSGNPGPGGYAAILRRYIDKTERKRLIRSGGATKTTNNRMELKAVIAALRCLRSEELPIIIRTDSTYITESWNERIEGWIKNGWRKNDGTPAANPDLWQQIVALAEEKSVIFEWVRGHNGDAMNEEADHWARQERDAFKARAGASQ